MERKLNPDIHIICGKCGCATMFKYYLNMDNLDEEEFEDMQNKKQIYYNNEGDAHIVNVVISCNNCGTLTYLEDLIEERIEF